MSSRWRPFKLKFSAILLPTFWTSRIPRTIYVSLLFNKDTNFFAHFDKLLLFCVDQTIGPFTNTVWIDTSVIESEKGSKIKPTPYVQWSNVHDFSGLYEKGLSTVFTWSGTKQLNNVSAAFLWKQIVPLRWPWNLTFSLYRSMHQNWQKCFKILSFQTKYTLMGWPWTSVVMASA